MVHDHCRVSLEVKRAWSWNCAKGEGLVSLTVNRTVGSGEMEFSPRLRRAW